MASKLIELPDRGLTEAEWTDEEIVVNIEQEIAQGPEGESEGEDKEEERPVLSLNKAKKAMMDLDRFCQSRPGHVMEEAQVLLPRLLWEVMKDNPNKV